MAHEAFGTQTYAAEEMGTTVSTRSFAGGGMFGGKSKKAESSIGDVRQGVENVIADLEAQAAELRAKGAEAAGTATALVALSAAFAAMAEQLNATAAEFETVIEKVKAILPILAAVEEALAALRAGSKEAENTLAGLVERAQNIAGGGE